MLLCLGGVGEDGHSGVRLWGDRFCGVVWVCVSDGGGCEFGACLAFRTQWGGLRCGVPTALICLTAVMMFMVSAHYSRVLEWSPSLRAVACFRYGKERVFYVQAERMS